MADRAALIEALDGIENGMCRIAETRDIWQHKLLYALCQGVRLLLEDKLKEKRTARPVQGAWSVLRQCTVNAWGEPVWREIGAKCSVCGALNDDLEDVCPHCGTEIRRTETV